MATGLLPQRDREARVTADENLERIAEALARHNREGTTAEAPETLYSNDAVSVEAKAFSPEGSREASGLDAIRAKNAWWDENTETHATTSEGPFLHGSDRFGMIFSIDVTMKTTGQRMQMRETGIYTVADGKIVREELYYGV